MINTEIISFYGISENVGTRTISSSFALKLAEGGKRVLYIEADYTRPSFAFSTGLSHPTKNMWKLMERENEFNILDYIASKTDVVAETKSLQHTIKKLPEQFYFLAFPADFSPQQVPNIENMEQFLDSFKESIKNAPFDFVIFKLPTEISEMMSYPIIEFSNRIVNVLGPRPLDSIQLRKLHDELEEHGLPLPVQQYNILNLFNSDYDHQINKVSGYKVDVSIPYDKQRAKYEWDLQIGSPIINEKVIELILKMDIEVNLNQRTTEKRLFGLRG